MSFPLNPTAGNDTMGSYILPKQPDTIHQIWEVLSVQLTASNPTVIIPKVTFESLTVQGKQYLLNRYSAATGETAMYAHDVAVDRICMASEVYLNGTLRLLRFGGHLPLLLSSNVSAGATDSVSDVPPASQRSGSKVNSANKIPRPPNAFIIYRKHHHFDVVAQNPGLHNNQISVIIGNMWSDESDEVRAEFKQKAEIMKLEHALMHPGYSYQPRKPSEKKRRMSKKKKAAALEAHRAAGLELVQQYAVTETDGDIANTELGRLNPFAQFDARTLSLPMDYPKLADVYLNDHVGKHLHLVNAQGEEIGAMVAQGIKPAIINEHAQQQDIAFVSRHLGSDQYRVGADYGFFGNLKTSYANWPDMVPNDSQNNLNHTSLGMDAALGFRDL